MKKMSIKTAQNANGGRWRCNYCGAKYWVYSAAWGHQNLTTGRCVWKALGRTNISWCW